MPESSHHPRFEPYPDNVARLVTETTARVSDITLLGSTFPSGHRSKVMGAIKGALFHMLHEIDEARQDEGRSDGGPL